MSPFAEADGHDCPRLLDEAVPGEAAMVDDVVVGFEDAVGEPVLPDVLPNILYRIEFWALGRQRHEGDVARHGELRRQVPSGLIEQEDGMGAGHDGPGNLFQVERHGRGVAPWQDQPGSHPALRADGAEDVG